MKQYIKFIVGRQFPLFDGIDENRQVISNEVSKLKYNGCVVDSIFRFPVDNNNYGILYHKFGSN